jgi:hypothetical protein
MASMVILIDFSQIFNEIINEIFTQYVPILNSIKYYLSFQVLGNRRNKIKRLNRATKNYSYVCNATKLILQEQHTGTLIVDAWEQGCCPTLSTSSGLLRSLLLSTA